jgi:hypothetical protein
MSEFGLSVTQFILGFLPVMHIDTGAKPFQITVYVGKWIRPKEKPAEFTITAAQSCLKLSRLSGRQDLLPVLDEAGEIARVNSAGPAPIPRLFRRQSNTSPKVLIHEINPSISVSGPDDGRNFIDEEVEFTAILARFLIRLCKFLCLRFRALIEPLIAVRLPSSLPRRLQNVQSLICGGT